MRPTLSGISRIERQQQQLIQILEEQQATLAVFGQLIARLVESQGGSWRVVECGTCLHDQSRNRFIEITLPFGPTFQVALHDQDVISEGVIEKSEFPLGRNASRDDLKSWILGISPVQETE